MFTKEIKIFQSASVFIWKLNISSSNNSPLSESVEMRRSLFERTKDKVIRQKQLDAPIKVSVIGVGSVGMAVCLSILAQGVCKNIAMVDKKKDRLIGEALDLVHGSAFLQNANIQASADYSITAGSKICVVTAGVRQKVGESRLDLVTRNIPVLKNVVSELVKHSPNTVIIVASNPVDILTYVTWKTSGLPKHHVIGSGTNLDTARFRYLLAERLGIATTSCHGYIIGEHGDSSVPVWSTVNVAGVRLSDLNKDIGTDKDKENWKALHTEVIKSAYDIVKLKGYTSWAIGLSISQLAAAIINDANSVHAVSTYIKGHYGIKHEIFLSLPCVLGYDGVYEVVKQPLNEMELKMIHNSADTMAKLQQEINI